MPGSQPAGRTDGPPDVPGRRTELGAPSNRTGGGQVCTTRLWTAIVLVVTCLLGAMAGGGVLMMRTGVVRQLRIVSPVLQPALTRLYDLGFEMDQMPYRAYFEERPLPIRQRRLDLGFVRVYWVEWVRRY